jgi:hypothetical protein
LFELDLSSFPVHAALSVCNCGGMKQDDAGFVEQRDISSVMHAASVLQLERAVMEPFAH